jgi:hypothetical protein
MTGSKRVSVRLEAHVPLRGKSTSVSTHYTRDYSTLYIISLLPHPFNPLVKFCGHCYSPFVTLQLEKTDRDLGYWRRSSQLHYVTREYDKKMSWVLHYLPGPE